MRRLFLAIVLLAFGMNAIHAQLSGVELGYGPMTFPGGPGFAETQGGAAYLNIMVESGRDDVDLGGSLIIAGNSRIQYGGEQFGYGAVGLVGNSDIRLGIFRLGVFAGGIVFQKYEKVDDVINSTIQQQSGLRPQPKLKDTNFQPFGGVKIGVGPVSASYAPAGNTFLVGIRLFNGN